MRASDLRIVGAIAAGLLLSACVASPTSDNALNASLQSAAVDGSPQSGISAEEQAILDESNAALAEEKVLALVAEPARLPRPEKSPAAALASDGSQGDVAAPATDLALAETAAQSPATQAAEQLVNPQPTATTNNAVQPAAEPIIAEGSRDDTVGPVETAATEIAAAPAQPVKSKPRPTVQASMDPRDGGGRPAVTKPSGGLFGLFAARQPTQGTPSRNTVKPSNRTVGASTTAMRSRNDGDALPGVKRQSALFGIGDGTEETEAERALKAMGSGNARQQGIQVASVGGIMRTVSPTGLVLQTDRVQVDCFKPELLAVLKLVERRYGKRVMVTSGYRSPKRNRRAGGASNSMHIYCKAADIQIEGVSKWDLAKYLRSIPGRGGVGTYCRTESVHIDVGSKRDWHHPCRRKGSKARKKA